MKFGYFETAAELEAYLQANPKAWLRHNPLKEPKPEPEPKVDQMKLSCFIYKLSKDRKLTRFCHELLEDDSFANMMRVFQRPFRKGLITIKAVKNEKDRYRLHVSDGKTTFDVMYPSNDKLRLMKKKFAKNLNK